MANINGKQSLVKFSEDPDGAGPQNTSTVYLVDWNEKTLRPFLSVGAFNTVFKDSGLTIDKASNYIKVMPTTDINSGVFKDFNLLSNEYGYKEDPTSSYGVSYTDPDANSIDESKILDTYGKTRNTTSEYNMVTNVIPNISKMIKNNPELGISSEFADTILNDKTLRGFYANALLYGDYTFTDILKDIKRRELVKNGDSSLASTKIISETIPATTYNNTASGSSARNNVSLTLPDYIGDMKTTDLDNPVYNIPSGLYDVLVQPADISSKDTQTEIEKIQASYYDVLLKQLDAKTEQDQAVAKENYNQFVADTEKALGIKLSDNANEAWSQLETLKEQMSKRGIYGSGIEQTAREKYLQEIRNKDQQLRDISLSNEESKKREYYLNNATSEEISQLSEEEKQKYGLIPSDELKNWFNIDNLKTLYPNLTDKELSDYANSVIDPNSGTLRSVLYQNYYTDKINKEKEKKTYQTGSVQYDENGNITGSGYLLQEALKAQKAYEPYEKSGLFSSSGTPTGSTSDLPFTTSSGQTISPSDPNYEYYVNQNKTIETPTTQLTTPVNNTPAPTITKKTTNNPPVGATYISDPNMLKGLKENQIWRDPTSKKIYKI